MIELSDIRVLFPDAGGNVTAVDSVSLSVSPGELLLISGASGSGKSTLLNVIAGLQEFDSGKGTVAGVDLGTASEQDLAVLRLEHVGVIFQENNLIREFSASENVQLPLRARGMNGHEASTQAENALHSVGLEGLGRRKPAQLSGGQRQRVGIARALVGGRSVLIADEPTGALDSENSLAIFLLLRNLADSGVAVVVASHDAAAEHFADTQVRMSDGHAAELVSRR